MHHNLPDLAPIPLMGFWSNLKFDKNLECSAFKCAQIITTKFYTHHDGKTVVICAKFSCDRPHMSRTKAIQNLVGFLIWSKYIVNGMDANTSQVLAHYDTFANLVNSLGPSDTIWHWRSWSTLVQVMACCLTAPSHYLDQCWLIISKVLWHSSEDIIIIWFEDTNQ